MKREKATQFVLSLICFTVYISLFTAATASAFNVTPYHFIHGRAAELSRDAV